MKVPLRQPTMEFRVPQFIDVEDKIVGQFSFPQIIYLTGGTFISYVLWRALPLFISFPLAGGIATLSLLLAFYPKDKYGKPFVGILEAGFLFYFINPKLYTWKRVEKTPKKQESQTKRNTLSVTLPNISESNLKNLSWGLDVKKEI